MKNENGVSLPILLVVVVVIAIVATVIVKYGMLMMTETKLQDLRTDMLLIQAETKKDLEEIRFQTVNLDSNKEEDFEKIKQIRQEYLKGTPVQETDILNNIPTEISIDENCYYLDESILKDIGVKETDSEKYGYYIVKYDFDNTTTEVMNTKGYEGQYTLTQLEND